MQEDDFVEKVLFTSTHDTLLFFSNLGKVYALRAFQIPESGRISRGLPLVNLLKFEDNEKLAAIINVKSIENDGGYILFGTKNGNIKKTELIQYKNIRSTGIRALILNDGDELIGVSKTDGTKDVIFGASNGKAACFNEAEVRATNRAAAGVKAIKLEKGECAVGLVVVNKDDEITVITEYGFGKRTKADTFKVKGRNGKGVKYMNITPKSGRPVAIALSSEEDDLMVITDKGMVIRTHLSDISVIGRDTQGVKIIKLNEGHIVSSIAVVQKAEETEEDIEVTVDEHEEALKQKLRAFEEKVDKADSEDALEELAETSESTDE
jgi:DNA gyrase subunit A